MYSLVVLSEVQGGRRRLFRRPNLDSRVLHQQPVSLLLSHALGKRDPLEVDLLGWLS